ncbi:MAG: hypothetical protein J4F33_12600 [Alphaproteobacteria bacterium]|nr:hypothetical protein [Alphaproteobacteria bacterium]
MKIPDLDRVTRLTEGDRRAIAVGRRRLDGKFARLRGIVPHIVDLSCREGSLPASHGHTLEDKRTLLELAKAFGFKDIAVSSFFDFVNIDEAFVRELKAAGDGMDGYFSNAMVVKTRADRPLEPSYGMRRIAELGIPNVLLLMEIRPRTIADQGRGRGDVFRDIAQSVAYLREAALGPPSARRGRIYARILDIFDAWDEDPQIVVRALKLLRALPVNAVIFEDVRGTHFPFQTAELVRLIRRYTPQERVILVHPHSGNGMEDATVIEAVLAGADGIWAGFTPHAAQGAHGSSLMLLSNLVRAGNPHIEKIYRFKRLAEIADRMSRIHMGEPIHKDHPVIGERAYRYIDEGFVQTDQPCDLDPARVGRAPGYRITPAHSSPWAIARRLDQLGYPRRLWSDRAFIREIRILMAEANIAERRTEFDRPEEVAKLVDAAQARLSGRDRVAAD